MHHLKPLLGVGQFMLRGLQAPLAVRQLLLCLLQMGPGASKDNPLQLQTGQAVGQPTLEGFDHLLLVVQHATHMHKLHLVTLQKITLVRSLNRPACDTAESSCSCKLHCIHYSVSQYCCELTTALAQTNRSEGCRSLENSCSRAQRQTGVVWGAGPQGAHAR